MSVNKAILMGRVGEDPEVKQFEDSSVANFSVATSEFWVDKQGVKQERTEWHRVVAWKNKFVNEYVKKGDLLYLEGKIQTRSYEDKDGVKKYTTEINARNVQKLNKTDQE